MQMLQVPAACPQFVGKVVEQQGMGRRLPLDAEVVWGANEGLAEVPLPNPIGDHAGGERVVGRGQPLCQGGAAALALERRHRDWTPARQCPRQCRRDTSAPGESSSPRCNRYTFDACSRFCSTRTASRSFEREGPIFSSLNSLAAKIACSPK